MCQATGAGVNQQMTSNFSFRREPRGAANPYPFRGIPKKRSASMQKTSFRSARRAALAAAFLISTAGLALAGGGGFHGGGFSGGFHGGFSGGSFGHGFGAMHTSSFGHASLASHSSMPGRSVARASHSTMFHHTATHMSHHTRLAGSHHTHLASSHHTHLASSHHIRTASSHHTRLANGGLPAGFSHGNAGWKQNGGTPPGWS